MIIEIENSWYWGNTITLICDGCGLCDIEFMKDTDWGYVCSLTVHPSRRRQGIATRLMEKAEELVLSEGYNVIKLAVEKKRVFQYEWYKKLGYEDYDQDEELYHMKKTLGNDAEN